MLFLRDLNNYWPRTESEEADVYLENLGKPGETWGSLGRDGVRWTWLSRLRNDWLLTTTPHELPLRYVKDQGGKLITRDMSPPSSSKTCRLQGCCQYPCHYNIKSREQVLVGFPMGELLDVLIM